MSSTSPTHIASLKHVIIYETNALSDLCQSWKTFRQKIATEVPYQASIGGIRLKLVELEIEDDQVWKIRAEKLGANRKDSNRILHYQGLLYVPEIIRTKLIGMHNNDLQAGYFSIKKTRELLTRKYYWETLRHNVEVYIRGFNICLVSKAFRHKPYENLQ